MRACAPGVDLVSTFFAGWNGDAPRMATPILTTTRAGRAGAARRSPRPWSWGAGPGDGHGTSAADAVARLVDHPALLRIPGLGTVVNVL